MEIGFKLCIPEAHNYCDPVVAPYFEVATVRNQRKLPDGSAYFAQVWKNEDPFVAMGRVKRATIIFIDGHANAGLISLGSRGIWVAKDHPGNRWPAIDQNDFSAVKFVGFVGCNTAQTDPTRGNLLDEAVNQGATTALGFLETIEFDEGSPQDPGFIWENAFWEAALGWLDENADGQWDPPREVWIAAGYASVEVTRIWGRPRGYDSYVIRGNGSLILAPARCK